MKLQAIIKNRREINRQVLFCCIWLLLSACKAPASNHIDSTFSLLVEISFPLKLFTTDKLQQCYLVSEKNEVVKFDPNGKELFRYNNNRLGNLRQIDVTDPFNVLLYYPDYQTVVTLDRTLSQTGEFDLLDLNLIEVHAIGMSNDNNIWLFDEVNSKLKKIDRSGAVLLESDPLNMLFDFEPKPGFILERENMVYINEPEAGILIFDNYGQYIKRLEIKNLSMFQVLDNQLIYRDGEQLGVFHLQTLATRNIELPNGVQAEDQVNIQKNRLFVQKKDRLQIYRF